MWYENLCLQVGEGVSYSDCCYKVQHILIQREVALVVWKALTIVMRFLIRETLFVEV